MMKTHQITTFIDYKLT